MSTTNATNTSSHQRFAFVEALRGFSALWVVLHHFISERHPAPTAGSVWDGFFSVAGQLILTGRIAVDLFFILSGFVIAYSIGQSRITARYAANFALRRSVRLDLPYWTAYLMAIGCGFTSHLLLSDSRAAIPGTWREVVANTFYLQILCSYKSFLPVAWTLCIEFQFYLFLLVTLAAAQWIVGTFRQGTLEPVPMLMALLTPLAVYSVLVRTGVLAAGMTGLVFEYWFPLHLGVLGGWVHTRQIRDRWLLAYAAALVAFFAVEGDVKSLVATLTGMSLYAASRTGYLVNGLTWRPLQYLGRISFSLYLLHMVLGMRILNLAIRWIGDTASLPTSSVCLLLAVGVSLASADVFNRFVERPSQSLSRRFRLTNLKLVCAGGTAPTKRSAAKMCEAA
jgi:peptidoglycan/LPS O-acetylase OafA/YrhL